MLIIGSEYRADHSTKLIIFKGMSDTNPYIPSIYICLCESERQARQVIYHIVCEVRRSRRHQYHDSTLLDLQRCQFKKKNFLEHYYHVLYVVGRNKKLCHRESYCFIFL